MRKVYDLTLKCSHLFNILDARGAISVTERVALIARVRKLACEVAAIYLDRQPARRWQRDGRNSEAWKLKPETRNSKLAARWL